MRPFYFALFVLVAVAGCKSEPKHEVRPLSSRPPVTTDYSKMTSEEKIKFIESSNASDAEKKQAIERVKAGQL